MKISIKYVIVLSISCFIFGFMSGHKSTSNTLDSISNDKFAIIKSQEIDFSKNKFQEAVVTVTEIPFYNFEYGRPEYYIAEAKFKNGYQETVALHPIPKSFVLNKSEKVKLEYAGIGYGHRYFYVAK